MDKLELKKTFELMEVELENHEYTQRVLTKAHDLLRLVSSTLECPSRKDLKQLRDCVDKGLVELSNYWILKNG